MYFQDGTLYVTILICFILLFSELQHNNNELLNQCEDLQEELKVKNSQFSALHLRVLETEKLLELERNNNTQLRAENERLLFVFKYFFSSIFNVSRFTAVKSFWVSENTVLGSNLK